MLFLLEGRVCPGPSRLAPCEPSPSPSWPPCWTGNRRPLRRVGLVARLLLPLLVALGLAERPDRRRARDGRDRVDGAHERRLAAFLAAAFASTARACARKRCLQIATEAAQET